MVFQLTVPYFSSFKFHYSFQIPKLWAEHLQFNFKVSGLILAHFRSFPHFSPFLLIPLFTLISPFPLHLEHGQPSKIDHLTKLSLIDEKQLGHRVAKTGEASTRLFTGKSLKLMVLSQVYPRMLQRRAYQG